MVVLRWREDIDGKQSPEAPQEQEHTKVSSGPVLAAPVPAQQTYSVA